MGQDHYNGITDEILSFGNAVSRVITYEGFLIPRQKEELERFTDEKRKEFGLASLMTFSKDLQMQSVFQKDHRIDLTTFQGPREGRPGTGHLERDGWTIYTIIAAWRP